MGKTMSFAKGKGNIRHNNREYSTPNVDKSRTADNVILKQQTIEDAYEHLFGKAVEDYNAKQKRSDRKKSVSGYMDEIKRNQSNRNAPKLFYEQVIGIGDMYDTGILTRPEDAQTAKEILLDYMKEWQERNPNLYVFNAVLHMDEATPHLHVDYIPVGHGYKQGLQAQNSLTKAFDNMGIDSAKSKEDNATLHWQARERARITEIANAKGVEIDVLGVKRKNYTIDEYKAIVHDEKRALKHLKAPEPKRIALPFNMALEVDRRKVDKYIKYKADVKSHAETYKKATDTTQNVQNHFKSGLEDVKAVKVSLEAEKAELEAKYAKEIRGHREAKEMYQYELQQQLQLNDNFEKLQAEHKEVVEELMIQRVANSDLRAQIADLRCNRDKELEAVQKPLTEQIEALEEHNQKLATSILDMSKAVSWLKQRVEDDECSRVCGAIVKHARNRLMLGGWGGLAEQAGIAEITRGIKQFLQPGAVGKKRNDPER